MTEDEKADLDGVVVRYQLTASERATYEAEFRQCLRCESSIDVFKQASEADIARALGHIVTPVLI